MVKRYLCLLFLIKTFLYSAQINYKLTAELNKILFYDQKPRELFQNSTPNNIKDSILIALNISKETLNKKGWKIVSDFDSINLSKIDKIILK